MKKSIAALILSLTIFQAHAKIKCTASSVYGICVNTITGVDLGDSFGGEGSIPSKAEIDADNDCLAKWDNSKAKRPLIFSCINEFSSGGVAFNYQATGKVKKTVYEAVQPKAVEVP